MQNSMLRLLLALLCTAITTFAADKAPAKLDTIVENAMKGYNAGDPKAFFADYASTVSAIATPQVYKALYEDGVKPMLGKFTSKTFVPGESSLNDDTPLLVYAGTFEKGKAKISVNFTKDGDALKVMQITIQPEK